MLIWGTSSASTYSAITASGGRKYAALGLSDRLEGVEAATPDQVAVARKVFADNGLHVV
ncbi:MAG: hypothetical protein ACRDPJ_09890 [Nocardioidaceae bacterium]